MRVVIVGGGIAGLAAAHALAVAPRAPRPDDGSRPAPLEVILLESSSRAGGKLQTERTAGYLIESGPDAFLAAKPEAIALCRELGLGDQLIPIQPHHRAVHIWSAGRLHRIPEGWRLIAPTAWGPFFRSSLLSWPAKARMALDLVIPARQSDADESVGAFMRRRLGREAIAKLGAPLLGGIYGAGLDQLSLAATFPQFAALERKHGSVIRGLMATSRPAGVEARAAGVRGSVATKDGPSASASPFLTLAGGTQVLADALAEALGEVVRTGSHVTRVTAVGRGFAIRLVDAAPLEADAVVLATPPSITATLIEGWLPQVAAGLRAIRTASSATVSFGYRREDVPHPLDGTGFMVAAGEPLTISGCTWTSSKFAGRAPEGHVLLRTFVGGDGAEAMIQLTDDALIARIRDDLHTILGITAPPELVRISRWRDANPLYDVGHLDRVAALEAALPPGLYLAGSGYHGVGVPDCVRQGRAVAERIFTTSGRGSADTLSRDPRPAAP